MPEKKWYLKQYLSSSMQLSTYFILYRLVSSSDYLKLYFLYLNLVYWDDHHLCHYVCDVLHFFFAAALPTQSTHNTASIINTILAPPYVSDTLQNLDSRIKKVPSYLVSSESLITTYKWS